MIRRHATMHWFWVEVIRNRAHSVFVTDDFGNLVRMQPGTASIVIHS